MTRVLIVDDEEGIRSFLSDVLEDAGYEIVTAGDGAAAVAAMERARVDLALVDMRMPPPDGMALLKRWRVEHPSAAIIMLTAWGTIETAVEAMRLGASDFLQKPLESPAAVRDVVARALGARAPATAASAPQGSASEPGATPLSWGAASMDAAVAALRKVARTQATVLLLGESGTGKEVAAQALHRWSTRAQGPFVAVNCGALASTVLESELFGHERGAFTGAHARRAGRIESASGGTFFLDEIAELRPEMQVKLLRVIQERSFERVGGSAPIAADVRWVAATHRDLRAMVRDGSFREDLYHRVAVFPVRLPPLRERRDDIAPLARHLLTDIARAAGLPTPTLHPEAERRLLAGAWPGNVRELRNTLERAVIMAEGAELRVEDLSDETFDSATRASDEGDTATKPLKDLEREAIRQALAETGGNRRMAAEKLGIGLRTLYEKLKRYGLE